MTRRILYALALIFNCYIFLKTSFLVNDFTYLLMTPLITYANIIPNKDLIVSDNKKKIGIYL
jgi:Na+/H+ antiporter NhaD/arsenite permease-like protein